MWNGERDPVFLIFFIIIIFIYFYFFYLFIFYFLFHFVSSFLLLIYLFLFFYIFMVFTKYMNYTQVIYAVERDPIFSFLISFFFFFFFFSFYYFYFCFIYIYLYHRVFEKYMNYTQVNHSVERDPFLFPLFLYGTRTSA